MRRPQQEAGERAAAALHLAGLAGALGEAILIEDEDHSVILVNQTFCDTFGFEAPPSELHGQHHQALFEQCAEHFADPQGTAERVTAALLAKGPPAPLPFDMADGRQLELVFAPITDGDASLGRLWIFRDVTEQRRAARDLAASLELLEAISTAQLHFIQAASSSKVFGDLLERLLTISNSEYGFIGEVVSEGGERALRTRSITDISWNEDTRRFYADRNPDGLLFTNHDTLFGAVLTTERTVISNTPKDDPRAGGTPHGHPPLNAFLGLPFFHGGQMVGMVGIANRPGGYDDALVDYLQPFLTTCAGIIYGLRTEAAQAEATAELKRARAAADEANRSKSEFLAVASHELRTPLNAIIGMSELAIDADKSQRRELLDAVARNAHGLRYLLDEVLELAHAESAPRELQMERFSVNELIKDVARLHRPRAEQRGLRVRALVDQDLPEALMGDAVRLRQVLSNLVHNAVKFTQDGEVTLLAERERSVVDDRVALRLTVRDTGPGLSEADQAQVFKRFFQADPSTQRRLGGVGLGLSICRSLVDLMGGELSVTSTLGQGSAFIVALTLAPGDEAREPSPRPSLPPGLKVLVVEDNTDSQRYAELVLRREGCEVDCALDGIEALDKRTQETYDLLLVDLNMPRLGGLEFGEAVRALEEERGEARAPMVAVTANGGEEVRARCVEAGFDDHLVKPYRTDELVEMVVRWAAAGVE